MPSGLAASQLMEGVYCSCRMKTTKKNAPLSLRVHVLSVPTERVTLKGKKNHTYCMSATGPPCIKLSCFSVIAVT